jgi:hypothetical protein
MILFLFHHLDDAKLQATLEGERKSHVVMLEGVRAQLRQELTDNSQLEQKLKDEHQDSMM